MINTLLSRSYILRILLISVMYMIFTTYLMNINLLIDTVIGDHSLSYKANLFYALLGGMWTAMSGYGFFILAVTALLTGINLTLFAQRLFVLRKLGRVGLVASGGSLLGLVASGCAACGVPLMGFLGLTGSLIYLPLRGMEIAYVSIGLLFVSIYFLMKSNSLICEVKKTL